MLAFQNQEAIKAPVRQANKENIKRQLVSMSDMIKSFALEIENVPCSSNSKKERVNIELQQSGTEIEGKKLSLPCAPSADDTTASSSSSNLEACYFKTRSGGYKQYQITIADAMIVFNRPNSTKQQELTYKLDSFQCIKKENVQDDNSRASGNVSGEYLIQIICSNNQQRSVYFETQETLNHWHNEILRAQGFLEARIDAYEPIGKLGQGSFGLVILSQHKHSEVKVAVKIINKAKIERAFKANDQIFEELDIMQEVAKENCINMLELIETFEDDEAYYVVTKLMGAGDLFNYICQQPNQPLTESHTKKIIRQVAEGVQALHHLNIIHRDIKIENILMTDFTEDSELKIGDLGSAVKLQSANDTTDFQIGTPGYLAPEVLMGKDYSFSCDIWSIGALMSVLLSAKLPFWEDDRKERKRRVCSEPLDLNANQFFKNLSEEAKDLISGMLIKNPTERLTIDQVLEHAWFN